MKQSIGIVYASKAALAECYIYLILRFSLVKSRVIIAIFLVKLELTVNSLLD